MIPPVEILRIATGGEGVTHLPDGKVCFVPRTAPGDLVHIEVTESHRRFSRGLPVEIAAPGPERVDPPCPYYVSHQCGACQLQHLSYDAQLKVKSRIVGDAMRRIGKFDVTDPPVVPNATQWGYRSRVRMRGTADGQRVGIGFRSYADPDRVLAQSDCLLATEPVRAAIAALAACENLPADLGDALIRQAEGAVDVFLETCGPATDLASLNLSDSVTSLSTVCGGRVTRVFGPESIRPLTFEQASPELARRIRKEACDSLGDLKDLAAADLFCGAGHTSGMLRDGGATVVGADIDRGAIDLAKNTVPGVQFFASPVEEALQDIGDPEVIVVNPPRTGLPAAVSEWIRHWGSEPGRKLAYISCDPPTLARDLAKVEMARFVTFNAYDLFPQTSHVEVLATVEN